MFPPHHPELNRRSAAMLCLWSEWVEDDQLIDVRQENTMCRSTWADPESVGLVTAAFSGFQAKMDAVTGAFQAAWNQFQGSDFRGTTWGKNDAGISTNRVIVQWDAAEQVEVGVMWHHLTLGQVWALCWAPADLRGKPHMLLAGWVRVCCDEEVLNICCLFCCARYCVSVSLISLIISFCLSGLFAAHYHKPKMIVSSLKETTSLSDYFVSVFRCIYDLCILTRVYVWSGHSKIVAGGITRSWSPR